MLNVVTPDEMAELDNIAMTKGKIPGIVLMENASFGVTQIVLENLKDDNSPVVILAGIGNNGGDGFCVARHLAIQGLKTIVYLVGKEAKLSGDALINWEILKERADISLNIIDKEETTYFDKKMEDLKKQLQNSQLILDALLGTGIKGGPREPIASVIKIANEVKNEPGDKKIVSVDIPSGVMGWRGGVEGLAVDADFTVTFALPKYGHFIYPGRAYTGKLYLCDIGISREIIRDYFSSSDNFPINTFFVQKEDVSSFLPYRRGNAHKGDFGHILTVAGSKGMLGACYLTVLGALRSGGGLVTAAVPESEQRSLQTKLTEGMTIPLPDEGGIFSSEAFDEIKGKLSSFDSLALGPGIRNTSSTCQLVKNFLDKFNGPVVMDADGLNVLSRNISEVEEILLNRQSITVLTPHVGELERLSKISKEEILSDPVVTLLDLVKKWKVYILLKGTPTFVATPEEKIYLISTGNPGMATGGSGDVLTGVLVSLLARGNDPLESIILGSYLHGLAGDLAAEDKGMDGLIAGDIVSYIPEGLKILSSQNFESNKDDIERRVNSCKPKIL